MDEEIERLVIAVRADTAGFQRDVAEMRGSLTEPMEAGANRAGRAIEGALLRAVRTGKLGFDDLGKVALGVMNDIARSAISGGVQAATGRAGGLGGLLSGMVGALIGLPGRATGGPVSPMRPYMVGERGPELFVPTSAGHVVPVAPSGARNLRLTIHIHSGSQEASRALTQSSRQVARAVKAALDGLD